MTDLTLRSSLSGAVAFGCLLLLSHSTFAEAATTIHVQSASVANTASGADLRQAFGSNNTAGNLVVAAISFDSTGGAIWNCSDSQGNVYAKATSFNDTRHAQVLGICYAPNIKAGANTVTVSFGGTSHTWRALAIHEYTGVDGVNPLDKTASNASTATTAANSVTSTMVTPTQTGQLIFGATMLDSGAAAISAGAGFTQRQSQTSNFSTEDQIQSTPGSVAATFTITASRDYIAQVATFRLSGAPLPPDTIAPTISLTAPANGTFASSTSVTVSATASDNAGMAGVQFTLDGINLGAEDVSLPYSIIWDTTAVTNGTHALSAVARDAAGNTASATPVTVSVDNQAPSGSVLINNGASATNDTAITLNLSATDNSGTVSEMRFSNTGASFNAPINYAATSPWTLTTGAGAKTVYVQFKDHAGNWSASFTDTITLDTTAPTISAVASQGVTNTSAVMTWTTNEPATSQVNHGPTTSYGGSTALDTTLVTAHSVTIAGLNAQTLYNYRVRSKDAAGNEQVGTNNTFTTLSGSDTTPPSAPTNLQSSNITSSSVTLSWTAGTDDVGIAGYQIFRNASQIATATQTSHVDTGLSVGTSYDYSVRAVDAANNVSSPSNTLNVTSSSTSPSAFNGPLRVNSANRRYFTDNSGKAIYMAGPHTWANFPDNGYLDPPTPFDWNGYLNLLENNHNNFIRLWAWEQSKWMTFTTAQFYFSPLPFLRTGPGLALDGKPKFDLTQLNQAYFDRLRQRVIEAGDRGIYVSIMLFDGWSLQRKGQPLNPWPGHPMNASNNINGINGDTNSDGDGDESHTLVSSAITAVQQAYLRKVIDAINDLDNVLFEITNEDVGSSANGQWQYHMINYIKSYEASKAKQHPVGMTGYGGADNDSAILASPADWISPSQLIYMTNPPAANGSKVIISDTDHLWGANGGDRVWVWKNFTRGVHSIFMDTFGSTDYANAAHPGSNPLDPVWVSLRRNMGYAIDYGKKMNLNLATPQGSLFSTGYGLANAAVSNAEYLGYLPNGGSITINLSATPGSLSVEWFNTATGATVGSGTVVGGASRTLTAPFAGDAVVYLTNVAADSIPPTAPGNLTAAGSTGSIALNWTAATDNLAVALYNVHRSTVSGFTPNLSNRVTQVSGFAYTDNLSGGVYYYMVTAQDGAGNVGPASNQAGAQALSDTQSPTTPANLQSSNITQSSITIYWSSSTDNVAVAGYRIFRDGVEVGATTQTTYANSGLTPSTSYTFTIVAYDASNNTSALSAPLVATSSDPTSSANLLVAYALNEASGTTATDSSGNGRNGNLINGPLWVAGRHGNALSFDGTNDYVSVGDVDIPSNALTLSCWIKVDQSQSNWGSIFMKQHTYGFEINGSNVYFGIGNGVSWSGKLSVPLTIGAWQYITAVYNAGSMTLYKDGVQVGSPVSATFTNSNISVLMGSWTGSSEFFKGQLDDVRLYSRALTPAEIQSDMNAPL